MLYGLTRDDVVHVESAPASLQDENDQRGELSIRLAQASDVPAPFSPVTAHNTVVPGLVVTAKSEAGTIWPTVKSWVAGESAISLLAPPVAGVSLATGVPFLRGRWALAMELDQAEGKSKEMWSREPSSALWSRPRWSD